MSNSFYIGRYINKICIDLPWNTIVVNNRGRPILPNDKLDYASIYDRFYKKIIGATKIGTFHTITNL